MLGGWEAGGRHEVSVLHQTVQVPPVLLLVVATALWGGNYIVGHYAVGTLSPLSLTWLRWALALLPLVVIAQAVERPNWLRVLRQWPRLLLMGVFGALGYPFLLYLALTHTSAVNASLINAANPALIVILAALFLRRPAGRRGISRSGELLLIRQVRGQHRQLVGAPPVRRPPERHPPPGAPRVGSPP